LAICTVFSSVPAWAFLAFHLLHAFLHVTSNTPNTRGMLFGLGSAVLAIMWAIFIVQMVFTDGGRGSLL
jgi:hypothetical protein